MTNIKKIAIIGPESTGKSTLSQDLSHHYQAPWVPEYARDYLDHLNRPYAKADLIAIAKGQIRSELEQMKQANKLLICDTNLIVVKIWSSFKYGTVDQQIIDLMNECNYDLHILTDIDLPWEYDPLRENPNDRRALLDEFIQHIEEYKLKHILISGSRQVRLAKATQAIDEIL